MREERNCKRKKKHVVMSIDTGTGAGFANSGHCGWDTHEAYSAEEELSGGCSQST